MSSLDVSKNSRLTGLNCSNNKLSSLDVSKNTMMYSLDCSNNQLTSLDVSNNYRLTNLDCSNNQLSSLDFSKNILGDLDCRNNPLRSLIAGNYHSGWKCNRGRAIICLRIMAGIMLLELLQIMADRYCRSKMKGGCI